jgi:hypothetical protein
MKRRMVGRQCSKEHLPDSYLQLRSDSSTSIFLKHLRFLSLVICGVDFEDIFYFGWLQLPERRKANGRSNTGVKTSMEVVFT